MGREPVRRIAGETLRSMSSPTELWNIAKPPPHRPLVDLGPVAEVALGDVQGGHDRPLREAELLADQRAGEQPMLPGSCGGQDLAHVDWILLRLGWVTHRAAGEQPHRPLGSVAPRR